MTPVQGEIWLAEVSDKRRPVLIVTRSEVVPVLKSVVVAPITRSVRGIPTEVPLDREDGLSYHCAAIFDNLQILPKAFLTQRIGSIAAGRTEICRALGALADC